MDDILGSLDLTDEQKLEYGTVQEAFQNHLMKRRNPIFERVKFNQRKQEEGESVDSSITTLYSLAKHCDYGALHDQMIRDRLVVGLSSDCNFHSTPEGVCAKATVGGKKRQPTKCRCCTRQPNQGKSGKKWDSKKKGPSRFSNRPLKVEAAPKI